MTDTIRRAIAAHQAGNLAEAEELYRAVLVANPKQVDARYNLGLIFGAEGRASDAVRELSAALEVKPDFFDAWFALCDIAGHIDQHELSRFAGEQAVKLMPNIARAWLRYGIALSKLGRDEEAIAAYGQSLALDHADVKTWINLAIACKNAGRPQEALLACQKAFAAKGMEVPDATKNESDDDANALLNWNLALVELLLGDYRQGFARYRARFNGGSDWKRIKTDKPLWRGEDLTGKIILVTSEFGYGDTLMMARYLPLLKEKGAHVLFRVPTSLAPLFTGWRGVDEVFTDDQSLPGHFDFHASLFDLPHRFGTTLETVPGKVPYLPGGASQERKTAGVRKIAIAWAGRAEHQNDRRRSLPLALFSEIFSAPGCEFFSFMPDRRLGDQALLMQQKVADLGPQLTDFAESARLLADMDLTITCDSALAHLAGGLGKSVWVLLPFVPDWRWLLNREDSPWYPTMRLFRQARKDDWGDVIARVKVALGAAGG